MPATSDLRNGCVLTIAGSDSGAGAGIQADLKSFAAHGLYGLSVITLVTAQTTSGVSAVEVLDPRIVRAQLSAVFADFDIRAVKTGALGSTHVISAVSQFLALNPPANLVIDPVMISKPGPKLIDDDAVATLKERLLPLATCITPNLPEAAVLTGASVEQSSEAMLAVGRALLKSGAQSVVVKGGHLSGEPRDVLVTSAGHRWYEAARVDSPHTHGTGCTFSSAIAANLALGFPIEEAVGRAKEYVTGAIANAQLFGKGINPVNHFWQTSPGFGKLR
jgi:hydroxymethylpyrimidine/phosphomethylpyrimidine kinase